MHYKAKRKTIGQYKVFKPNGAVLDMDYWFWVKVRLINALISVGGMISRGQGGHAQLSVSVGSGRARNSCPLSFTRKKCAAGHTSLSYTFPNKAETFSSNKYIGWCFNFCSNLCVLLRADGIDLIHNSREQHAKFLSNARHAAIFVLFETKTRLCPDKINEWKKMTCFLIGRPTFNGVFCCEKKV